MDSSHNSPQWEMERKGKKNCIHQVISCFVNFNVAVFPFLYHVLLSLSSKMHRLTIFFHLGVARAAKDGDMLTSA